jgi:hypothetical protein
MKNQKDKLVGLRLSKRYKKYLQRLATNQGLSMAQWLRKNIAIDYSYYIQNTAEKKATRQAAKEINVPEIIANKLDRRKEALSIIPADDHKEYTLNVNKLYPACLKDEMQKAEFKGLREELKELDIV